MTLDKFKKSRKTQAVNSKTQSSKSIMTKFGKWNKILDTNVKNKPKKKRNNISFETFTSSKHLTKDQRVPRTAKGKVISKSSDKKNLKKKREVTLEQKRLFQSKNSKIESGFHSTRKIKKFQKITTDKIQAVAKNTPSTRRIKSKQYPATSVKQANDKNIKVTGKSLERWRNTSVNLNQNRKGNSQKGTSNNGLVKRSSKNIINKNIGCGSSRSIGGGFPRNSNYNVVGSNAFPGMKPPSVGLFNNHFTGSNYFNTRSNGFW